MRSVFSAAYGVVSFVSALFGFVQGVAWAERRAARWARPAAGRVVVSGTEAMARTIWGERLRPGELVPGGLSRDGVAGMIANTRRARARGRGAPLAASAPVIVATAFFMGFGAERPVAPWRLVGPAAVVAAGMTGLPGPDLDRRSGAWRVVVWGAAPLTLLAACSGLFARWAARRPLRTSGTAAA